MGKYLHHSIKCRDRAQCVLEAGGCTGGCLGCDWHQKATCREWHRKGMTLPCTVMCRWLTGHLCSTRASVVTRRRRPTWCAHHTALVTNSLPAPKHTLRTLSAHAKYVASRPPVWHCRPFLVAGAGHIAHSSPTHCSKTPGGFYTHYSAHTKLAGRLGTKTAARSNS